MFKFVDNKPQNYYFCRNHFQKVRSTYKRKNINLFERLLNKLFRWRIMYVFILAGMIVIYPFFVSDGQGWSFVSNYQINLPLKHKIHGIDVSHHNDHINWEKVAKSKKNEQNLSFVFIKATEGSDMVDKHFKRNWKKAKKVGLVRGAYHFYVPSSDPKYQALNFILNVKHEEGDLVPVLDFEIQGKSSYHKRNLVKNVGIWLKTVEQHFGKKPIIYTNKFIYNTYLKGNYDEYPYWISQYETKELEGYDDADVSFWQHSMTGKLEGIKGDVDFNVFIGSEYKFNKLRF